MKNLELQGKLASINSAFFCSTIFSFAFLGTFKVKKLCQLCDQKKCQAEESLQFCGIK